MLRNIIKTFRWGEGGPFLYLFCGVGGGSHFSIFRSKKLYRTRPVSHAVDHSLTHDCYQDGLAGHQDG